MVSEEEYQKVVSNTKVHPSRKTTIYTPIKIAVQVQDGQIDQGKVDAHDTPKEEEQQAVQTLVNLPFSDTPTKSLHESSNAIVLLQMSTQGSSALKVAKVIHYGDTFLDEEIEIPQFNFATMTLEDINLMQATLERKN